MVFVGAKHTVIPIVELALEGGILSLWNFCLRFSYEIREVQAVFQQLGALGLDFRPLVAREIQVVAVGSAICNSASWVGYACHG